MIEISAEVDLAWMLRIDTRERRATPAIMVRPCLAFSVDARGKLTKEHVFPQWLLDVIPGEGKLLHEWIAPEGSDSKGRKRTTSVIGPSREAGV